MAIKKSILELGENEIILAPTKEALNKLLKKFNQLGLEWIDGMTYSRRQILLATLVQNAKLYFHPATGTYGMVALNSDPYIAYNIEDLTDFDAN